MLHQTTILLKLCFISSKIFSSELNFLFVIFILSFISNSLFSKTIFLKCDAFIFKISEPVLGFNKAYIVKEKKWSKIKEFEVNDDNYLLKNIYAF